MTSTGGYQPPLPLSEHAIAIGLVTIAWNSAQEYVFRLFHMLSGMSKPMAESVFFTLKADSAQRDITRALCRTSNNLSAPWREEVAKLLSQLDKLSSERNAAIHTMWDNEAAKQGQIMPSAQIDKAFHHKSLQQDPKTQFTRLRIDLANLADGLRKCIRAWESENALPQTPPEPHLPREANTSEEDHPKAGEGEEPPPQPSAE